MKENRTPAFDFVATPDITGIHYREDKSKLVEVPLGKFTILVKVTEDNKFLSVEGVKVSKDFISYQKKSPVGYHDVDEYYRE